MLSEVLRYVAIRHLLKQADLHTGLLAVLQTQRITRLRP
jgi:hypothetical protein